MEEKNYKEAEYFIHSLKLAFADIRDLDRDEIDYIIKRANELAIPNVKEYIIGIRTKKIKSSRANTERWNNEKNMFNL